jgi:hypothetical protein
VGTGEDLERRGWRRTSLFAWFERPAGKDGERDVTAWERGEEVHFGRDEIALQVLAW